MSKYPKIREFKFAKTKEASWGGGGQTQQTNFTLQPNQKSEIKLFVYDRTYAMNATPNQTKALSQSPNG